MATKGSTGGDMASALQRISAREMLVVPETADQVIADLAKFSVTDPATGAQLELTSRQSLQLAYGYDDCEEADRKPFVFQDGVAVIPIHGTLINRFNSCWGFVTGYNYIRRMTNAALDDEDVDLIVYDVDSPGGEAAGCFELAYEMMAGRRVKPSLAMVDSCAASGGFALAGAATSLYAIPSARIGSIGVYRMHVSIEGMLKDAGVKITFATAGDHKTDGNMYQDLPQRVLDEWRESAGKTWDDFISLVAEARDMSEAAVRDTQARVYRSDEALALGLINAVKTTTEAVSAFVAELAADTPDDEEDEDMADLNKPKEVTSALSAADLSAIGGMIADTVGTAISALTRSQNIIGCAEAKDRPKLAATLAADPTISLDTAKTILSAAAVETAAPKPKRQRVADDLDEDDETIEDDDDETGEHDDDDETAEDDDTAEDAAETARRERLDAKGGKGKGGKGKQRVQRREPRDNVNHLDRAMGGSARQPRVGVGDDRRGRGRDDAPTANTLLADHAAATGADWSKKACAGNA